MILELFSLLIIGLLAAILVLLASLYAKAGKDEQLDSVRMLDGQILARLNSARVVDNINECGFKVFSQCDDDGIIQYLLGRIGVETETFIEFGVEDFFEATCRFLLQAHNWSGFVIDGSAKNIRRLEKSYFFWKHDLTAKHAFVTRENINSLLAQCPFDKNRLGILHIDLDGNDYHILEALESYRPGIMICEYNAVFGADRKISVPYDKEFVRTTQHYSNLYFGASLAAFDSLLKNRGYSLVGINSCANNAYFVRNDLLPPEIPGKSVADVFADSKFRESRDRKGRLSFLSGAARLAAIEGMPVLNVETGELEKL